MTSCLQETSETRRSRQRVDKKVWQWAIVGKRRLPIEPLSAERRHQSVARSSWIGPTIAFVIYNTRDSKGSVRSTADSS